jgi:hypothetical protein
MLKIRSNSQRHVSVADESVLDSRVSVERRPHPQVVGSRLQVPVLIDRLRGVGQIDRQDAGDELALISISLFKART